MKPVYLIRMFVIAALVLVTVYSLSLVREREAQTAISVQITLSALGTLERQTAAAYTPAPTGTPNTLDYANDLATLSSPLMVDLPQAQAQPQVAQPIEPRPGSDKVTIGEPESETTETADVPMMTPSAIALTLATAEGASGCTLVVRSSRTAANLRAHPGTANDVIATVPNGTAMNVVARTAGPIDQMWYQTYLGWIAAWLVETRGDCESIRIASDIVTNAP
jgi:hypothetical protein